MRHNIVELKHISKSWGAVKALNTVNLDVRKGEILTLLGPSGCGKSTLLSLLKNEISADGGSMTFPGNWQLALHMQQQGDSALMERQGIADDVAIDLNMEAAQLLAAAIFFLSHWDEGHRHDRDRGRIRHDARPVDATATTSARPAAR